MLPEIRDYDSLVAAFRWRIPQRYNIGVDVCDRWAAADPARVAILDVARDGRVAPVTYGALREALEPPRQRARGERRRGAAIASRSCCPRVRQWRPRMSPSTSSAPSPCRSPPCSASMRSAIAWATPARRALVTDAAGLAKLTGIRADLPALRVVISIDGPAHDAIGWTEALARASPAFTPVDTAADDPALMIYTSGTTGPPKGALHAHRVLLGHLPGVQMPHEFLPQPGDLLWTPADWAWIGGLVNVLLPGLHFGVPVVARKFEKFDPEEAFRLMADLKVRNAFIPPTALRMLRTVANPRGRFDLALRTIGSGGETLGAETFAWGREALGVCRQRVLRADRSQSRRIVLRGHRRRQARHHGQGGSGAQDRHHPRRTGPPASRANSGRSRCGGPTRSCSSATGTTRRRRKPSSSATG